MNFESVIPAFGLTLFAGLATGIGSALAFFTKRTNTRFLSLALGFSAGVMIYVSFYEMLPEAQKTLIKIYGKSPGSWISAAAFFGGIFLIGIIDKLVPDFENPHEVHNIEEITGDTDTTRNGKLMRLGLFSAFAIAIHNFPEGLATFTAAITNISLGIPIAIAIAIHNIPEGIAISIPIFYATGNRKKAFFYSFLSGLAEPAGALIGFAVLFHYYNETIFGILFSAVAGIMVFISLDELLPAAREWGEHHISIYGLVSGMIVMAVSLLLL